MKKVVLVLVLMAGLTAMAQKGGERHRGAKNDMTPEQMATLHTKKMTLALDLTEAQRSRVNALNLENAKMRKAKMEERKAKKEGERKKPTSEERFAMQNARLDHMIAQKAELKKILSEEQYVKWEKMQRSKNKHHRGKGKKKRQHSSRDKG